MLKELKAQHRSIIQMSFNGFKNNEIAEKLEMSPGTISSVLRSPLGKAYLDGLLDKSQEATLDVRKQLIGMNKGALSAIGRILDPKVKAPHNVQLAAAKDVLDRNGYKPTDKYEIDVNTNKSDAEIEAEITAMEVALERNQLKKVENLASTEESSLMDASQEISPFTLDESDSANLPKSSPDEICCSHDEHAVMSERPETSGATSIPSNIDDDLKTVLANESFDPFKSI